MENNRTPTDQNVFTGQRRSNELGQVVREVGGAPSKDACAKQVFELEH